MNVYGSLRDKLQSVQQDISSRWRNFTTPEKQKWLVALPLHSSQVDLNAGADLLHKFQQNWRSIHADSEINANLALHVNREIAMMCNSYEKQCTSVDEIMSQSTLLPQLFQDVDGIVKKLGTLEQSINDLQRELFVLEDLIEQEKLHEDRKQWKQQIRQVSQRHVAELEMLKVQLAKTHSAKVAKHESNLQQHIRERQKAFEPDFSSEMELYRRTGHTQLQPSDLDKAAVSLADINLEHDSSTLDEFLKSADGTSAEAAQDTIKADGEEEDDSGVFSSPPVKQDEDIDFENFPEKTKIP